MQKAAWVSAWDASKPVEPNPQVGIVGARVQPQRFQQGRLAGVVFAADQVDASQRLNGQLLETTEVLNGERGVHGQHLPEKSV